MKIEFLFSFLKLLAETADQSEYLSTHLFLIEDLYKRYQEVKENDDNTDKMNSIFEQLCKSIIRELFELMRKIKRGKIMLKHKDFFVKSAEMFKTRLICEIKRDKNKDNVLYYNIMHFFIGVNLSQIKSANK